MAKPAYPIKLDLSKLPDRSKKPSTPEKRTPREEREKAAMEKKYPFNKYAKGGGVMKKGVDGVAKKGHTKGMEPKMAKGGKCYAKGGAIDGVAKKGKTKGRII